MKRQDGQDLTFPQDIQSDCGTRIEIVINDMAKLVVFKFIAEHNHALATKPSNSRLHMS